MHPLIADNIEQTVQTKQFTKLKLDAHSIATLILEAAGISASPAECVIEWDVSSYGTFNGVEIEYTTVLGTDQ
jgi:hypothetical protein